MPLINYHLHLIESAVKSVFYGKRLSRMDYYPQGTLAIGHKLDGAHFPIEGEVTGDDIATITRLISQYDNNPPRLKHLVFNSCNIGDIGTQLDTLFSNNPEIDGIDFIGMKFSARDIENLAVILKNKPNTLMLNFLNVHFDSNDTILKFKQTLRDSKLKKIYFYGREFTFEEVGTLAIIAIMQRKAPWEQLVPKLGITFT